jgi:hypothetical protein
LREDWVNTHVRATPSESDGLATSEDVVEFNAETFKGESV